MGRLPGVPATTLFTAIGVTMERGQSLRRVFEIFMNIEARLTERIGEAGKRLHTARSCNDQVATDCLAVGAGRDRRAVGAGLRRDKPGMDPGTARKMRAAQGWVYDFTARD